MRDYNFAYGNLKKENDEKITDIVKCYLLLNYCYNTEEENKVYKAEFKRRYISFYNHINEVAEKIEDDHVSGISNEIKDSLAIGFYQSSMSFLGEAKDDSEPNLKVDEEFQSKTSTPTVKRNFFYNHNCEFGTKSREHVNITQYGTIDPEAKDNTEDVFIFSALTTYFRNTFKDEFGGNNKTLKNVSA